MVIFSYKQLDKIRELQRKGDGKGANQYKTSLIESKSAGFYTLPEFIPWQDPGSYPEIKGL